MDSLNKAAGYLPAGAQTTGIHFFLQSREAGMIAYPEDFLTMRCTNPSDDNAEDTPFK